MGIELFIWLQILQKFMAQLANLDQVKMGFSLLSAFYYTFPFWDQESYWYCMPKPIFHSNDLTNPCPPHFSPLQVHVRGVWLSLCQHCTHRGRLQENIRHPLIYRIIRPQYLVWQQANVPDTVWAICSQCLEDTEAAVWQMLWQKDVCILGLTM